MAKFETVALIIRRSSKEEEGTARNGSADFTNGGSATGVHITDSCRWTARWYQRVGFSRMMPGLRWRPELRFPHRGHLFGLDSSAGLRSDLRKIASRMTACSDPHGNKIERRSIEFLVFA